ncbi:MAG TPA: tetratricopeptide repeat protein [Stellaceae bacterium]|nr:tetratricopeptide repeat protein [Stellaceae bacterium]
MNQLPPAGRLAAIEQRLRQAIKAAPRLADAHFRLGLFLHQTARLAEAEPCYRAALRLRRDHLDALNNLALLLEARGERAQAETLLRRGLAQSPGAGTLRCNLARLQLEQGRLDEAAANFERALDRPEVAAAAHCGLGMVRCRQDRLAEAEALFFAALQRDTALGDAHNEIGLLQRRGGRLAEAEQSFRAAIRVQPALAAAHLNLGALLLDTDRLDPAEAAVTAALAARPDWADALYYLGAVQRQRQHFDAAEATLRRAIALDPRHASALALLGLMLQEEKRTDEAERLLRDAVAADPSYIEARVNLGRLLWAQRREGEACEEAERALRLAPDSSDAINLRGMLWEIDCVLPEALAAYERAVTLAPENADAQHNLGRLRLLEGRFAEGWEGFESRLKTSRAKSGFFAAHHWDGTPLAGKTILLHAEQGLGDTLQFCRYVPLVAARGGEVILAVQPPLASLLAQLPGAARTFAVGDERPVTDFLMPLASLPRLFTHDFAEIPAADGYLRAPDAALERWRGRFGPQSAKPRIGLAWAGNPEQDLDRNRSASLAALLPLLDIPGIDVYSLQVGARAAEITAQGAGERLVDLSAEIRDFVDTAAILSLLDLVITVDTSVAHLAGALGRPGWVMLSALPDWRWHLDRSDCPWYRSLHLFRQPRRGDWASVVGEIAARLRRDFGLAEAAPRS